MKKSHIQTVLLVNGLRMVDMSKKRVITHVKF
jgi:hypothetical protein